jgi:cytochrome c2
LALQIIQQKCEVCHTLNGTGATIGPNLNLVMEGKVNLVPGGQPRNPTWLAAWITNPHRYLSTAIMPAGLVSGSQLEAVVKYLTTQVK